MAAKKRACKSCKKSLADAPPGEVRCETCQQNFEQWLRGDSPTTYTPRRDGVWADIHRSDDE
jgi:hypothetical protein